MTDYSWLSSTIEAAAKIANPLSLAGFGLSLFFGAVTLLINRAKIDAIGQSGLISILKLIFTYAFLLSLVALIVGVSAWLLSNVVGPMIMGNTIQSLLLRHDYKQAITLATPYLQNNPRDDVVRHELGTSYFVTGKLVEGRALYKDMEALYPGSNDCEPHRASAIASIAAFDIPLGKIEDGLSYSNRLINCKQITDPYMFNHMNLLAIQDKSDRLEIPNGYQFHASYFKSKYALLQFAFYLKKSRKYTPDLNVYLKDAYCDDDQIKKILENRFEGGDFSASAITAQEFGYESGVLTSMLSREQRADLTKWLTSADCAV
ncbi:hypothetical protein FJ970_30480 [Mesorhizobium sp. B2-1-8]|uniref:tetratricopeptide repeat protein n=1 Tax=Mesorhizobium sp. B2-1-8 TaxID=2589967 RepID=UPI00112D0C07|nr:hypothetical protein [Mesorhizobium sp. B2-1-8]UCI19283.1 hypothetical protein FJ970_30480 [Mesorhizobium sp. B2-1-8]